MAGGAHSLALTHTGTVYSWGSNASGQLGRPLGWSHSIPAVTEPIDPEPKPVAATGGEAAGGEAAGGGEAVRYRGIACGSLHSVAVSEEGELYAWGCADEGRLGLGGGSVLGATKAKVFTPRKVEGLAGVAHVAAGWSHTLAATRSGRVYGWGDRGDHCLGLAGGSSGLQAAPEPCFEPTPYPAALCVGRL